MLDNGLAMYTENLDPALFALPFTSTYRNDIDTTTTIQTGYIEDINDILEDRENEIFFTGSYDIEHSTEQDEGDEPTVIEKFSSIFQQTSEPRVSPRNGTEERVLAIPEEKTYTTADIILDTFFQDVDDHTPSRLDWINQLVRINTFRLSDIVLAQDDCFTKAAQRTG